MSGSESLLSTSTSTSVVDVDCRPDGLCGRTLADCRRRLADLSLELALASDRERERIAIGLHDGVGQDLATACLHLAMARTATRDEATSEALGQVVLLLKKAITATRDLTFELDPPVLQEYGLEAALRFLTTRVSGMNGLRCTTTWIGSSERLPVDTAAVLHGVIRELVHNVVKHANARSVVVAVTRSRDSVRVEVVDDGDGFDARKQPRTVDDELGFGLFSARRLVSEIGGCFALDSQVGSETRVTLTVPLPVSADGDA